MAGETTWLSTMHVHVRHPVLIGSMQATLWHVPKHSEGMLALPCSAGKKPRNGGVRCDRVLQQLWDAKQWGLLRDWRLDYHRQHRGAGKQQKEQRRVLGEMRSRGICRPGCRLVLGVEVRDSRFAEVEQHVAQDGGSARLAARRPHGLVGREPANKLSAERREQIVRRVLGHTKPDPEKKLLHVHNPNVHSLGQLLVRSLAVLDDLDAARDRCIQDTMRRQNMHHIFMM